MVKSTIVSAQQFGRVAVVMGGWSAEREVSLMSGQCVLEALVAAGVDAYAVDADKSIANTLSEERFDRAFLILHGRGGEDGTVQGALELADVPYTGSGVLASALAMDKCRSKSLVGVAGVPIADSHRVQSLAQAHTAIEAIGLPVVIKPVFEGSSIGVTLVQGTQQIETAFADAHQYGDVMVERLLGGAEVTASVLGETCLPLIAMRGSGEFYDYEAKYLADDTEYDVPAQLPTSITEEIQAHALTAFNALGCRGWARIDFMLDESGMPFFMECNTAPGMTSHSLVPQAAAATGMDFQSLCMTILAMTLPQEEVAA